MGVGVGVSVSVRFHAHVCIFFSKTSSVRRLSNVTKTLRKGEAWDFGFSRRGMSWAWKSLTLTPTLVAAEPPYWGCHPCCDKSQGKASLLAPIHNNTKPRFPFVFDLVQIWYE